MFRSAPSIAPPSGWWTSRPYLLLLVLLAAVPLITPSIPPLTDLMGHMGRYRVELADPNSMLRTRFYSFDWAIMGNLGVDLLIVPLSRIFGLELGVKLIVLAIPPLTVAGLLAVAREAHGRIPATAVFALPLAYGFPFQWGFVNFVLSMALALNAFGLWLWLTRLEKYRLRTWLFVPISVAVWLCHVFGWGVLGLLVFASEYVRAREKGEGWLASFWHGGLACVPLSPPILLMLLWRGGDVSGQTKDFFNWKFKWVYLKSILRNHWMSLDLACAALLGVLVALGLFGVGFRMNRKLGIAALMLIATYILLPRILLGSAYADMRLAPFMVAVAVIAVTPRIRNRWVLSGIAAAAAAIFVLRIGVSTEHFAENDRVYREQLAALDHVPAGSRVFVLVDLPCLSRWDGTRLDHLGAMAIVRRDAFVNGQWSMPGAQLIGIRYAPAKGYSEDPTQIMRPRRCRSRHARDIAQSVEKFPRFAFDYLWMVNAPGAARPVDPGLQPVWQAPRGALYRIVGTATAAMDTPSGSDARLTQ